MSPQRHPPIQPGTHARPHHHRVGVVAVGLRPKRWQRWAVYLLAGLLFATGIAWLAAHYLLVSQGPFGEQQPSAVEPWALRLHGVVAYGFVFIFGSMSVAHIALGWRLRRHLVSGIAMTALCAVLAGSAVLLYYAPEDWHGVVSAVHWCVGLALLPVLLAHIVAAAGKAR